MITIKIQCACGQRYAFDAEPANGMLPSTVACPVCGVDGTEAANAAIAQSAPAVPAAPLEPALAAAGGVSLRIARAETAVAPDASVEPVPVAPRRRMTRLPGQIDPDQAVHEARAKISWGDPPEEVTKYLMMQGFSAPEARQTVTEMFEERARLIRRNGMKKIFLGIGLICVPIATLLVFLVMGVIFVKILGFTVMIGLWGAWMVLKGIFMTVAPKFESGDVAEH